MRANARARAPRNEALSMTLIAYLTLSRAPLSDFLSATTTTPKAPLPTIFLGAKSEGEKGCSDSVRSDPPRGGGGGSPALRAARTLGGVGTAGNGARDVFFFSFAGDLNIAANLPARDFRFCGGGFDGVFPSRPSVPRRLGAGAGAGGVGGVIGDAIDTRGDASCRSGLSSFFSSSTPSSSFGVRGDTGASSSTAIASKTSRSCRDTACAAPRDVAPASKRTCSTFSAALRVASHQASSPLGPNDRRTQSVAALEACFSRSGMGEFWD
mmetsp:Transcript_16811/g.44111  ORF Transcript_16811/g.44111 Transcript_16811/m.44111 type:complete len:268 (-) Transcript_16811:1027-1830(-)